VTTYELLHARVQEIQPRLAIFMCERNTGFHLPPVRRRMVIVAILEAPSKPS
jgi:hypothetical protein